MQNGTLEVLFCIFLFPPDAERLSAAASRYFCKWGRWIETQAVLAQSREE